MSFKRIIELCEKHGFLKRLANQHFESNFKESFHAGPAGVLLQENLKNEWFYNMVINRDNTVFISNGSFSDTYAYAKEMCQERLPFGVAEVLNDTNKVGMHDFNRYFLENNKLLLRTTMFVSPSNAMHLFHHWQKQRRMWWRKLSASPGRYSLTDIQSNDKNHTVEIKADYSWGPHLVECFRLSNGTHDLLTSNDLLTKDGRKKVTAHLISSEISLPSMLLNALCDAYEEPVFQNEVRPLFRFHRKLAPYKISFAVSASQSAALEELSQLALYLCKKLRANHVSCLLIPGSTRNTLEMQWKQYDELGVPYAVLLNENTLRNGVTLLRSRDTTLKEQVHLSSLPTYVEQLFRNY